MTNRLLRDVTEYVVPERGIVVFDWEKDLTSDKWEIAAKVTSFNLLILFKTTYLCIYRK